MSVAPPGSAGACAACGAAEAYDGDGYCKVGGHRLAVATVPVSAPRPAPVPLAPGARVGCSMIREASGIVSLDIDEESALHAGRLPGLHSDPFDRMLVAQAIVHGMTILTPDPEIEQYAVRVLW